MQKPPLAEELILRIVALAILPLALVACSNSQLSEPVLSADDSVRIELRGNFGDLYLGDRVDYYPSGRATRQSTTSVGHASMAPERELGTLELSQRAVFEELFANAASLPDFLSAPDGVDFPRSDLLIGYEREGVQRWIVIEGVYAQPDLPAELARTLKIFETFPSD